MSTERKHNNRYWWAMTAEQRIDCLLAENTKMENRIKELEKDCIRPCTFGSETESAFMAGRMLACEVRAELKDWKAGARVEAHEADNLRAQIAELKTIPNDYACTCGGSEMTPCNGCLMNKAAMPYKIQVAELEERNNMLSAEIGGIINAPDCEEECVPIETLKIKNAKLKADLERMKRLEINLNGWLQKEGNEVFEANKEIVKLKADIEKAKGLLKMCYKELSEKDVEVVKLKAVAERLIKDLNV